MDDWNAEALPSAVTDPDERATTEAASERFRQERLERMALNEAHAAAPEKDPARQGAFDQKPDVQQQQIELWAYKALSHFEQHPDHDWPEFIRIHELPPVWVETLVKPRFEELRARRAGVPSLDANDYPAKGEKVVPGLFSSTEVQLEGGGSPPTGATGHVSALERPASEGGPGDMGGIDRGPLPSEQAIAETDADPLEPVRARLIARIEKLEGRMDDETANLPALAETIRMLIVALGDLG